MDDVTRAAVRWLRKLSDDEAAAIDKLPAYDYEQRNKCAARSDAIQFAAAALERGEHLKPVEEK